MISSKFSGREQALLAGTAAVIITTILYGFIIEPLINNYGKMNAQIGAVIMKLRKSSKLLQDAEKIRTEYQKYAEYAKGPITEEEDISNTLKTIESIARKNNFSITNLRPQPVMVIEEYRELVFEVSAEADISEISKFIYDLQMSGNLLRVVRLTVSASSRGKKTLQTVMEITKPSIREH